MKNLLKKFLGLNCYKSEIDQFLTDFDAKNPKLSTSQHREKKKYELLNDLRDHAHQPEPQKKFWDKF